MTNIFKPPVLGKLVAETVYPAYEKKEVIGLLGCRPLKDRIEEVIAHAERHGQMNDALWPFQPFGLTVGELLRAALSGCKSPIKAAKEPATDAGGEG